MRIIYSIPNTLNEIHLAVETVRHGLELTLEHPRQEDYYGEVFHSYPNLILIAKYNKKIIGVVLSSKNPFKPENSGEILIGELFVHPDFQRMGIGQHLLMKLEINAKELGFIRLIVGSVKGAENFYLKCGFKANLQIQIENGECLDNLKKINPNYPIKQAEIENGWTRFMIETEKLVPDLESKYHEQYENLYAFYVFTKDL